MGYWAEYRSKKRSAEMLPDDVVAKIDKHTTVDAQLFAAALRLLLGRLRTVEEATGLEVLKCIDWIKLKGTTDYIPGLWSSSASSSSSSSSGGGGGDGDEDGESSLL